MVGARGFEPPTSYSRSRRANQTALRPDSAKNYIISRLHKANRFDKDMPTKQCGHCHNNPCNQNTDCDRHQRSCETKIK